MKEGNIKKYVNSAEDNVMQIYSSIKSRIIRGELAPNSKLTETTITKEFCVSRLHVKSAFRLLHSEQLIYHVYMKGYFVQELDSCFFEEIIALRQALETVVITKVIEIATPENIRTLKKMSKRVNVFIKNKMIEDGLDEVNNIYHYLYQVCNFRRIVSILETFSDYIAIIRQKSAETYRQHLEYANNLSLMVKAIEERNIDRAVEQIKLRHKYWSSECHSSR